MKKLLVALFLAFLPLAGAMAAPCPPEGDGGDTILNLLKNRSVAPASYREMDVEQFLADFTPDLHTPKYRNRFSWAHNRYVEKREEQGIALVGYLVGAKQSGPESCNCHDPTRRDFHVWIGPEPPRTRAEAKAMRARSVVVEPTPAGQEAHPNWRLRILRRLAADGARVRISGPAMYDPEHPDQLGKTRATLWEVHPVTRIEVWSGGAWREL